jgi:hypothetical protein
MKAPIIRAITEQTDQEWPVDHPLRQGTVVLSDKDTAKLGTWLICSLEGEDRLVPQKPGDHDVTTTCSNCPRRVVHRASAPNNLKPICWICWEALTG